MTPDSESHTVRKNSAFVSFILVCSSILNQWKKDSIIVQTTILRCNRFRIIVQSLEVTRFVRQVDPRHGLLNRAIERSHIYRLVTDTDNTSVGNAETSILAAPIRAAAERWGTSVSAGIVQSRFLQAASHSRLFRLFGVKPFTTPSSVLINTQRVLLTGLGLSLMLPWATHVAGIKIYPFDFLLLPLAVVWIVDSILADRLELQPVDIVLFLFIVWGFLPVLVATLPRPAFNGAAVWLRGAIVFIVARSAYGRVYSHRDVLWLAVVVLSLQGSLAVIQGVFQTDVGALNQYVGTKEPVLNTYVYNGQKLIRAQGTLSNSNVLASWFIVLLPLGVVSMLNAESTIHRVSRASAVLLGIAGLVLTLSRGAILIFTVMGIGGVLFFNRARLRRVLVPSFVVTILMLASVISYTPLRDRFLKVMEAGFTRLEMIMMGIRVLKDRPFFGTGYDNFAIVKRNLIGSPVVKFESPHGSVHNIYMLIATEAGIPALLLFLLFVLLVVRQAFIANHITGWENPTFLAYLVIIAGLSATWIFYISYASFQFNPLAMVILGAAIGHSQIVRGCHR